MVSATVSLNLLLVSEGSELPATAGDNLEKLGWHIWQLSAADLLHGEATSRPSQAALVALPDAFGPLVQVVRLLSSEMPALPIVVLTNDLRAAEQALRTGAAAILPPLAPSSLVHVQLQVAVQNGIARRQPVEPTGILRAGALTVDTFRRVITVNDVPLELTPTEYRILSTLVRYSGRALEASFLLQQGAGFEVDPVAAREVIKVHIARLRRKLAAQTDDSDYIANVRNVGYILDRRQRIGWPE